MMYGNTVGRASAKYGTVSASDSCRSGFQPDRPGIGSTVISEPLACSRGESISGILP